MQQRTTMTFPGLVSLRRASLSMGLIASLVMTGWAHADHGYQNEVLADSPILYYQFNEDPGAVQVVDSSGDPNFGDPANGGKKDSQFLGTRTERFPFQDGFELIPGQGVILGGMGPVGRMVEFDDPDEGDSFQGVRGGYIETGLHYNMGPTGPNPDGLVVPVGWSVEFLHRDDRLQPGDNRTENVVMYAFDRQDLETVGTSFVDFELPTDGDRGGTFNISTDEKKKPADGTVLPEFVTFFGGTSIAGESDWTYANETPVEGEWRHIVLTYEASNATLRWYINGVMTNEQVAPNGGANIKDTDAPLLLGASSFYFPVQYFDGFLDEFAVYDYRLDDPNDDKDLADSRILPHFNELNLNGLDGDFDGDGDVDGSDFLLWQRDLGDEANLALWTANFGNTSAVVSAVTVPEPAAGLLAAVMMVTALGAGRGRQRSVALD